MEAIERAIEKDVSVGVALNIDTQNETLDRYLPKIDLVQFMGIARIGYQGEPFDERVIPKIKELREKHPETIISVDGGVGFETAPALIEAGVNRLVSGSEILEDENVRGEIERFKQLIKEHGASFR